MTGTGCESPLDPAVLAEYWLGELPSNPPGEEERVEEHLLACGECARKLQGVIQLADSIRKLMREGLLRVFVSAEFVTRLEKEGLRIRQYRVAPGTGVACTIRDQDDLVVGRLEADLAGAGRVDLSRCDAQGHEVARLPDIPLMGSREEVVWTEPTDFLRTLGKVILRMRLIAVEQGGEQVLGEYTFNHSGPGPDES